MPPCNSFQSSNSCKFVSKILDSFHLSQYTEREKGNKSPLSDENEKKLRDIGFVFKVKGNKDYQKLLQSKGNERFESTWEKYFKELKVRVMSKVTM